MAQRNSVLRRIGSKRMTLSNERNQMNKNIKNTMNQKFRVNGTKILTGLCLAAAVMLSQNATFASGGATSTLNVSYKTNMLNTGVEPDASGKIVATLSQKGSARNQTL